MARAAEVAVGETDDGRILVAVAGAMVIDALLLGPADIMRDRIGIGTQLDRPERNAGARKGMAHPGRADERIDIGGGKAVRLGSTPGPEDRRQEAPGKQEQCFMIHPVQVTSHHAQAPDLQRSSLLQGL